MLTQDQIKERIGYIGGSDAAAVCGVSRWATSLSVWAEKTGQLPVKELDSEAVELGLELEDYVARRFMKKSGKTVRRVNETLYHPTHKFLAANLDRRVVGEKSFLECKAVGAFKAREWEGEEIPIEYIFQCMHYLAVTGLERAYIAVLIGNRDFVWKVIERDENALTELVSREVSFWNDFVIPKIMPTTFKAADKETLTELFPEAKEDSSIELDDTAASTCEILEGMESDCKALENQIEAKRNELRALLGKAERGVVGPWEIHWSNVKTRRLDQETLKKELPDVFEKYRKLTTTRKFLISKKDQKQEASNG